MHRSVRHLLGFAATAAVIAIGLPAAAASANAATLTTTAASSASSATTANDFDEYWGPYYSKWYNGSQAKARGHAYDDGDGNIHVTGKLYDKHSPKWLCAYIEVKFENSDGDDRYFHDYKCGDHGYKSFDYYWDDVDNASVRVSYYDYYHHQRKYAGKWYYVYESDNSI
jgi:hypothetical protein